MDRLRLRSPGRPVTYKWVDLPALAIIVLLALSLAAAAYLARGMILTSVDPSGPEMHVIEIGGRQLTIERAWLMGSAVHGDRERISLRLPLDRLISRGLADPDAMIALVFMTSDESLAPAERVKMLYARFLSSQATPTEGGLIRRQFRDGTPYEGEALFLSPPEGRAFAARCPTGNFEEISLGCFAEIRHAGYDIQIQLAKRDLALWEKIIARVKELPPPHGG